MRSSTIAIITLLLIIIPAFVLYTFMSRSYAYVERRWDVSDA